MVSDAIRVALLDARVALIPKTLKRLSMLGSGVAALSSGTKSKSLRVWTGLSSAVSHQLNWVFCFPPGMNVGRLNVIVFPGRLQDRSLDVV